VLWAVALHLMLRFFEFEGDQIGESLFCISAFDPVSFNSSKSFSSLKIDSVIERRTLYY